MLRMNAHCFISTEETRTRVERAFADHRLCKAVPSFIIGGFTEATARYTVEMSPPLIVIEADDGDDPVALVDALSQVCDAGSNLILLGTTNDIDVYRALMRHGIAEYLITPFDPARFIGTVLDLFAGPDKGMAGQTDRLHRDQGRQRQFGHRPQHGVRADPHRRLRRDGA